MVKKAPKKVIRDLAPKSDEDIKVYVEMPMMELAAYKEWKENIEENRIGNTIRLMYFGYKRTTIFNLSKDEVLQLLIDETKEAYNVASSSAWRIAKLEHAIYKADLKFNDENLRLEKIEPNKIPSVYLGYSPFNSSQAHVAQEKQKDKWWQKIFKNKDVNS